MKASASAYETELYHESPYFTVEKIADEEFQFEIEFFPLDIHFHRQNDRTRTM